MSENTNEFWSARLREKLYPLMSISQQQQQLLENRRQLCRPKAARQWVLVAPLRGPTNQIASYAVLESWTVLIVEREGTPRTWRMDFKTVWDGLAGSEVQPNLIFLDRHMQQQLKFASGALEDSPSRSRNIGSLFAIMCGAEVIVEAEEVVEQKEEGSPPTVQAIESGPFAQAFGDKTSHLINPYALYGYPEIWPRGFPLAAVSNATFEYRKVQRPLKEAHTYRPLIQSTVVDEFPTVDATLGLTQVAHQKAQQLYRKPAAIAVDPGYFAPLNLGSTAYHKDAFWALALLAGPNEVLAPVWRSLWVQRLLWDIGGQLLVLAPSVKQQRTDHDVYVEALLQEMEGHAKLGRMIDFLYHWQSDEKPLHSRMLHLARDLKENGLWSRNEAENMAKWWEDLIAIGYSFPEMRQSMTPADGHKKKKLAALCYVGQADRAPDAIGGGFSHVESLLKADSDSQEALQLAETFEHTKAEDGSIEFGHDSFAYVSTHGSCSDHIRWVSQHQFTYSIMYNDPVLTIPYPLDQFRFGNNPIVPMLYQMHAQERCFEMVQEYSRQHNIEYSVVVKLRTDHHIQTLANDTSSFAFWSERSLASVIVPMPLYDYSDMFVKHGGYQDRIGWGPTRYMQSYMTRWSHFFNKTHMDSDAPFHGESSLWYALTTRDIPVERLEDDQLLYYELPHSYIKCSDPERHRSFD